MREPGRRVSVFTAEMRPALLTRSHMPALAPLPSSAAAAAVDSHQTAILPGRASGQTLAPAGRRSEINGPGVAGRTAALQLLPVSRVTGPPSGGGARWGSSAVWPWPRRGTTEGRQAPAQHCPRDGRRRRAVTRLPRPLPGAAAAADAPLSGRLRRGGRRWVT